MKPWFGVLLISISMLLTACFKDNTPVRPVRAITIQLSDTASTYSYPGVVRAHYDNPLAFQVGGKMLSRLVDVGNTVHAGQLLATLDTRDLKLNVQNKTAQLRAAESDLNLAKTEEARYAPLFKTKVVSASQYQQVVAKYQNTMAAIQQVQSDLNAAQQQLAYANLSADYDGIITQVLASPGQVVTPGQSIFQLARSSQKEVVINVPEQRIVNWRDKNLSKIVVRLWAYPQKQYNAETREIADDTDPTTRTYTVKLAVTDADKLMRLGMTATVLVKERQAQPAITLPLTAIFHRGNEPYVWVIDPKTMKVHAVAVKLGNYTTDSIIIASGLRVGQMVVTAGANTLKPEQKVNPLSG